jgi:hypothetical protein
MHFATRFRLFFLGLLPLLAGFMASSCQSSRPGFSFQPAPYRAEALATAPASGTVADAALPQAPPAALPAHSQHATPAHRASLQRVMRLAALLPQAAAPADPTVAATAQPQARHLPRLLRQRATHGAAENGLGRVALFFIGVALALVAGLAALFALIPGVSFLGGVGLAVAALVVLYLLYSLVSGGKKKA